MIADVIKYNVSIMPRSRLVFSTIRVLWGVGVSKIENSYSKNRAVGNSIRNSFLGKLESYSWIGYLVVHSRLTADTEKRQIIIRLEGEK